MALQRLESGNRNYIISICIYGLFSIVYLPPFSFPFPNLKLAVSWLRSASGKSFFRLTLTAFSCKKKYARNQEIDTCCWGEVDGASGDEGRKVIGVKGMAELEC